MFRMFRFTKWSKHVVKCGQKQEKVMHKIPIASARQPRLFLCHIVTLIRKLIKSFPRLFSIFFIPITAKIFTALNKEKPRLKPYHPDQNLRSTKQRKTEKCLTHLHLIFLPLAAFSLDGALKQRSHAWQKFILP